MSSPPPSYFHTSTPTAERYALNDRGFGTHQAMLSLIPHEARVLDVGCADGSLGATFRADLGAHVIGVEIDPAAAETARDRLNDVIVGRVDDPAVLEKIREKGPFDCLVFGDVLEHMIDPDVVLATLLDALADGGCTVISLPNVLTLRARGRLFAGIWEYEDKGIFDRTHLRFFSVRSARELISAAGLTIVDELPVGPLSHRLGRAGVRLTALRPGLLATQLVVRAVRSADG